MSQDKLGLTLGSGRVRVAGRYIGQVVDFGIEKAVTKAEHTTNVGIEFRRDFVLSLMTMFNLSWTFQEIVPFNVNFLLGQPGFRSVPSDRKLPSAPINPGVLGNYSLQHEEFPMMGNSVEGSPIWAPLMFPIFNPNTAAPLAPVSIAGKNVGAPGTILNYKGFFVALRPGPAGPAESVLSNVAIVPNYSAAPPGETVTLFVTVNTGGGGPVATHARVYRYNYVYNSTYGMYIGTQVGGGEWDVPLGSDPPHDAPNNAFSLVALPLTVNPDGTTTYTITVDTMSVIAAAPVGYPVLPFVVSNVMTPATVYSWLGDFDIQFNQRGGAQIRRTPTGTIPASSPVRMNYSYNAGAIVEAPLGWTEGENPTVPVSVEIPLWDNKSKYIWHFWKVQINSNFRIASNERDWWGVPFVGETLDDSEQHPEYPFGMLQVTGPMAERIVAGGNIPFSDPNSAGQFGTTPLIIGGDRTSFA